MNFILSHWFIATAQAAVRLPEFPEGVNLTQFITDLFDLAIALVGAMVFVRLVWAGVLYIFGAASGGAAKAKKMITDAVIGAIILLSAYLILNVINPELKNNCFVLPNPTGSPIQCQ